MGTRMFVSCVCCVGKRPLRRTDHSFRGVQPAVYLIMCDLQTPKRGSPGPSWTVEPQKKNSKNCVKNFDFWVLSLKHFTPVHFSRSSRCVCQFITQSFRPTCTALTPYSKLWLSKWHRCMVNGTQADRIWRHYKHGRVSVYFTDITSTVFHHNRLAAS